MNLEIEKLDHQGRGIAHINDKIVFIENALPGEIVDILITKQNKKIAEAIVKKYIKKSDKRIESVCPYYKECGGCNLLHMSYKDQLEYKQNKVIDIMKRFALLEEGKVKKIVESPNQFNYRNKVTFKYNGKVGYYKRNTNDIVNINYCHLLNESLNKEIENINNIRTRNRIKEIVVRDINESDKQITFDLQKYTENITYPSLKINYTVDNRLIKPIDKSKIIGKICNKEFEVSPTAFFQVNTQQVTNLYNKITEYVKKNVNPTVLDLYCGTGTIGICVSDYAKKILGIEINKMAIIDAKNNAKINNVNNIDFIAGDTKTILKNKDYKTDIIILDPPRAGLDKEVIEDIKRFNAKEIIYVSCDPITLARDIKLLSDLYDVKEVTPFDMFPNTYHVECVCVMKLR
ncbi:MAG TPA: class I SAM-dependent RNA methyltransferase [Bacilli bacterium]|nr:class I SAM-dependent RNA methyltransferase [Bacilli bacterium]